MVINRLNKDQLRLVVAGSVSSSRRVLQGLLRHRANVVGVLGLGLQASRKAAGCRLDDLAQENGIAYVEFENINHLHVIEAAKKWSPDILFVVGLSQLVKSELLSIPRLGCIGFHPTWLPEGRGRAPIAWLVLDGRPGAATFFSMDEGVDSGPILAQEPFYVASQDYAEHAISKMELAIDAALDRWLPRLLAGAWEPKPQATAAATYNARRRPEDGLIDWHQTSQQIHTLIRATSRPHPGAYTYANGHRLIIWHAEIETQALIRGVIGRIVLTDPDKGWLVQTGQGLLWLTEVEIDRGGENSTPLNVGVGTSLGYSAQDEIHALKERVASLEQKLFQLESSDLKIQ